MAEEFLDLGEFIEIPESEWAKWWPWSVTPAPIAGTNDEAWPAGRPEGWTDDQLNEAMASEPEAYSSDPSRLAFDAWWAKEYSAGTTDQMCFAWVGWEAATAAERERIISIIEGEGACYMSGSRGEEILLGLAEDLRLEGKP